MDVESFTIQRLIITADEGAVDDPAGFGRELKTHLSRALTQQQVTIPTAGANAPHVDAGQIPWNRSESRAGLAQSVARQIAQAVGRAASTR